MFFLFRIKTEMGGEEEIEREREAREIINIERDTRGPASLLLKLPPCSWGQGA